MTSFLFQMKSEKMEPTFGDTIVVNNTEITFEIEYEGDTEIKRFPTLYKKDKLGRLSFWRIYVIDDMYYRESGLVTGKVKTYEPVQAVSKNVGRSNQTTPEQQALFEAFSEWKHKKKQLYTEAESGEVGDNQEDEKKPTSSIGGTASTGVGNNLRPMLAQKFSEQKHKVKWPAAISPKLDGVRVMIYLDKNGEVVMLSRQGKVYQFMNGIREEAKKIFEKLPCVLDGELYSHNIPFNAISGVARTTVKPSKYDQILEYYVFDLYFPDQPQLKYSERMAKLRDLCGTFEFKRLRFLFYELASDEKEVKKKHDQYVEQGYEGLMIRNLDSLYLLGKRSSDLLKYKEFEDAEFPVVDVIEGVGTEKGAAIFVCRAPDGSTFNTRPRGSIEKRRRQFKNKHLFIGKMLTVRYQPLTKEEKLPRFPIGIKFPSGVEDTFEAVGIRDYE